MGTARSRADARMSSAPALRWIRWIGPLLLVAALQDDEIVREFQRTFRRYEDTPTRVEAVLALEGSESPAVVGALVPVLASGTEPEVVDACVRVLARFETRPPAQALLAALAGERSEPVRLALLQAATEGRYAGTADVALELCAERSWPVRRRAVLALCATGDARAADAALALVPDREPAVRCAALEGLAALGSPAVLPAAREALGDESWQVRSSAIAALGRVRDKASIPLLIGCMETEEGRLRADAAGALAALTGRSFGGRADLWRRFWESNAERYELPDEAELQKLRARQAERAGEYSGGVSYHGIDTPSRRIVFVIDVSGSMEQSVMEKERFEGGGYPSMKRIDIVKTELARTIERLEPYVRFNILAFATDVRPWKKDLVPANALNKSSALSWIGRLEAIGGASKQALAEVGLVAAADLEGGRTNTYGALMRALGADGGGRHGPDYEVDVDTVFFLSDGRPSHGAYIVPEDILREVRAKNELRKVVIHVIAIGDVQVEFMRALAVQNGGQFVDLGR
jgi:HEAT repeat protein